MTKWLYRSILIGIMLLVVTGTAYAAFNWSEVSKSGQRARESLVAAGQSQDEQEIEDATSGTGAFEGEGTGFYMTIYEDTVRNPDRRVKEEIKKRFGIEFDIERSSPNKSGQVLFYDFFEDPWGRHEEIISPKLETSLQSDCVRIKSAQADDEIRKWRIVKRRLKDRQNSLEEETPEGKSQSSAEGKEVVDINTVVKLLGLINEETERRTAAAIASIPEYESIEDNRQILLKCYEDFSYEVDFELRLQNILLPSKKQMEVMQTFMNGRLDDFSKTIPGTNKAYGSSFPKYDLIFDIDVMDMIIFGSPIGTDSGGTGGGGSFPGFGSSSGAYGNYQELEGDASPPEGAGEVARAEEGDKEGDEVSSEAEDDSGGGAGDVAKSNDLSSGSDGGFGTSSNDYAGPECSVEDKGIELDYSTIGDAPSVEDEEEEGEEGVGIDTVAKTGEVGEISRGREGERAAPEGQAPEGEPSADVAEGDSSEGYFKTSKNSQVLCDGTFGFDFGNDMLKLMFCIGISFDKVGKTWENTRDENCIACHMYKINQTFEEEVLDNSVRPHKNAGNTMESAVCEDGYGDDLGFFSFIEWVPVKFYPEVCYPKGGVTDEDFGELVGYPELVSKVNRQGFEVDCDADYADDDANKSCKDVLGKNNYSYDEFIGSYLDSIKIKDPIESVDDVDKDSVLWAKLVGDQGVAERELHIFMYRLGKVEARFNEEVVVEQDFKEQIEYLERKMSEIRQDKTLIVDKQKDQKVEQLLCLKGYFMGEQEKGGSKAFDCRDYEYNVKEVQASLDKERERIGRITQRWNERSKDFNEENRCGMFSGSGIVDAFWDQFEDKLTGGGYYFNTEERKIQSSQEQVTGQITANMDIEDFGRIFEEIDKQVQAIEVSQENENKKRSFESDQERSLLLFTALAQELTSFKMNLRAYTEKWAEIVTKKKFTSKGGDKISCLESFTEKLQ